MTTGSAGARAAARSASETLAAASPAALETTQGCLGFAEMAAPPSQEAEAEAEADADAEVEVKAIASTRESTVSLTASSNTKLSSSESYSASTSFCSTASERCSLVCSRLASQSTPSCRSSRKSTKFPRS